MTKWYALCEMDLRYSEHNWIMQKWVFKNVSLKNENIQHSFGKPKQLDDSIRISPVKSSNMHVHRNFFFSRQLTLSQKIRGL